MLRRTATDPFPGGDMTKNDDRRDQRVPRGYIALGFLGLSWLVPIAVASVIYKLVSQ